MRYGRAQIFKNTFASIFALLFVIIAGCKTTEQSVHPSKQTLSSTITLLPENISRFAFGSCAKERLPQPIWKTIEQQDPELFLFIGDNNYADYWAPDGREIVSAPVTDVNRLKEAYQTLSEIPGFNEFRAVTPMLGTWDDHDYGANDQGKEYPLKAESQQIFLDFFAQ